VRPLDQATFRTISAPARSTAPEAAIAS